MRKHNTVSLRRYGVAAVAAVLSVTACERAQSARDSRVIGVANAVAASPAPVVPDRPAEGSLVAQRADKSEAMQASFASLGSGSSAADASGAMLIRTGDASIEVHRVEDALVKARQTAAQFGGFVANTALQSGKDEQHAAKLELRVPTTQFDALVGALNTLGKVESISASAQDVGEEYVDLGARAANARHTEARLTELLANRTGKLSEVLTVEQELKRVREEIERYDARLRWLEHRTATSTLTVTLHEPLSIIDRPRPGPLVEALGLAWERMLSVIAWCIASLGLLVPLGVLVAGGVVVARRLNLPFSRATPDARV